MENANITKELAPFKTQVSKAETAAIALQIKTADDLIAATDLLGKIKSVLKIVKSRMEAPIKVAYQAYKNIKTEQEKTFGALVNGCEEAERVVKDKMVDYQNATLAKAAVKIDVIEKKVEAGTMSFEKAADKIEAITPAKSVEASSGAVQFRTIREVIIENESLLPREYLVPDMIKIRKVALAGVEIAGVKVVDKQVVAGIAKLS